MDSLQKKNSFQFGRPCQEKLLFNKDAEFELHRCAFNDNKAIDKELDYPS